MRIFRRGKEAATTEEMKVRMRIVIATVYGAVSVVFAVQALFQALSLWEVYEPNDPTLVGVIAGAVIALTGFGVMAFMVKRIRDTDIPYPHGLGREEANSDALRNLDG